MNPRMRMLIMLPVLGIAAWLAIFGDKRPASEVAGAVTRTGSGNVKGPDGNIVAVPPERSAPVSMIPLRPGLQLALDQSAPVNLFAGNAPPPPPPVEDNDTAPQAPPANFTFIGRRVDNGVTTVFLDKDNQTWIATKGAMLGEFRVEAIQSNQIQLTHVPTKTTHIVPIDGEP